jgi:hypothetical protein
MESVAQDPLELNLELEGQVALELDLLASSVVV